MKNNKTITEEKEKMIREFFEQNDISFDEIKRLDAKLAKESLTKKVYNLERLEMLIDVVLDICNDYTNGNSISDIARFYGVTYNTIKKVLVENDFNFEADEVFTEEDLKKIVEEE